MTTRYTTQAPTVPGWYHAIPWEFVGDDDESPLPVHLEIIGDYRRVHVSGDPCAVDRIALWGPRIEAPGGWQRALRDLVKGS